MSRNRHKIQPQLSNKVVKKNRNTTIDFVIPVLGNYEMLEICLDSISKSTSESYSIYIVDNGSPKDERIKFYRDVLPSKGYSDIVTVRTFDAALGYPRACNTGADQGISPYILFLNSDCFLMENSVDILLNRFIDPTVGVGSMKLTFPESDLADDLGYYREETYRPVGKIQHVGLATSITSSVFHIFLGWDSDHPKPNSMNEVLAVTGACLMVRRKVFNRVGRFDTIYGLGTYEDVDLCLKIRSIGYKIIVETKACAIHVAGGSAEKYKVQYPLDQNYQTFLQRWSTNLDYSEWRHW